MWVAPEARGLGLGRRLLCELERHAKRGGATTIRLETNRALAEAVKCIAAPATGRWPRSTQSRTPITGSRRRSIHRAE